MSRLVPALVLVLAFPAAAQDAGVQAALPEAQPLNIDVQVTPEEISLGEHVTVKIAVDHDARDVYSLPGFDPAPLAVPQGAPGVQVHREEVQGHARTTFELTLADYATLEPRVPDLTLHVTGPDGERVVTLRGRPIKFHSVLEQEGSQPPDVAHHGPKPPVEVLVRSYLWAWVAAGVALLCLLILFWKRLTKRKQLPKEKELTPAQADDLALEHLAALKSDAPWTRGEGRAAIFRLSEIVRAYLGERLSFNALDLTSEEFLGELHRRRLMGLDLAELTEEVRWEDLVKFAKVEPTADECLRGISRAESLVHHTRPLRAAPVRAA